MADDEDTKKNEGKELRLYDDYELDDHVLEWVQSEVEHPSGLVATWLYEISPYREAQSLDPQRGWFLKAPSVRPHSKRVERPQNTSHQLSSPSSSTMTPVDLAAFCLEQYELRMWESCTPAEMFWETLGICGLTFALVEANFHPSAIPAYEFKAAPMSEIAKEWVDRGCLYQFRHADVPVKEGFGANQQRRLAVVQALVFVARNKARVREIIDLYRSTWGPGPHVRILEPEYVAGLVEANNLDKHNRLRQELQIARRIIIEVDECVQKAWTKLAQSQKALKLAFSASSLLCCDHDCDFLAKLRRGPIGEKNQLQSTPNEHLCVVPMCGITFGRKSDMFRHVCEQHDSWWERHWTEPTFKKKCSEFNALRQSIRICLRQFQSLSAQIEHLWRHRKWCCEHVCKAPASTSSSSDTKKNKNKAKPSTVVDENSCSLFLCSFCYRTYTLKTNLARHKRNCKRK